MTAKMMALGWYVRFAPVAKLIEMDRFYTTVLELPIIKSMRLAVGNVENKNLFWGGEAIVINHNFGALFDDIEDDDKHPDSARQVEIFRVPDLEAIVMRLRKMGAEVSAPRACFNGREAFVTDPMGAPVGLREPDAASSLPQDLEGVRRRRRGEAFNPGCGPMPGDLQELGWVKLSVSDLPELTRFYQEVVGLPVIRFFDGAALLDMGDNSTLELVQGGKKRPPPIAQKASLAATIFRVTSVAAMKERLRSAGAPVVHELYQFPSGSLSYVADPDGNLVGFSDRLHPQTYVDKALVALEDLEAQRRWVEAQSQAFECAGRRPV